MILTKEQAKKLWKTVAETIEADRGYCEMTRDMENLLDTVDTLYSEVETAKVEGKAEAISEGDVSPATAEKVIALRTEYEALKAENVRLTDLIRQRRAELYADGLISNEEYARLAEDTDSN